MSDAQFTPGPWRVDFEYDPSGPCILAGERFVCGEIDNQSATSDDSLGRKVLGSSVLSEIASENIGNAALIAAAPDLYDALFNALALMELIQADAANSACGSPALLIATTEARAAIARATQQSSEGNS